MKQGPVLLDSIVRLYQSLERDHALSAREIVHLLEERNLFRFRGRDRAEAEETIGELLADRFVFRSAGRGAFSLQHSFWLIVQKPGDEPTVRT